MGTDFTGSEVYTPQMGNMTTKGTEKILNIFFIVDISGSMHIDNRIGAVNEAFTQMIPALRQVQIDCQSDFELRIAIMTFDETARWIVAPTPVCEYTHEEIECSDWVTYFSRAFKTLGDKLTKDEYMAHTGKIAQPYIMFMTDGEPTEDDDYRPELDKLLGNAWFTESQRFAVLIGKDTINSPSARAAVERFVTNPTEGIINAADAAAIAAEVQAKTIHTLINMTKHNAVESGNSENLGGGSDEGGFGEGGFGEDGFGGDDFGEGWDFDNVFSNKGFI